MDDPRALERLCDRSTGIERAALLDGDGSLVASHPAGAGEPLAAAARAVVEEAEAALATGTAVERVEVHLPSGSLLVVRGGGRTAVAATSPEPVTALAVHDLRALLTAGGGPARRGRRRPAAGA